MRKSRFFGVLASGAALSLALAPAGGASASGAGAPGAGAPDGGTLHVVMPWARIPRNFNPLNPGGTASTAGGTGSALYEPLMYDNIYSGKFTPVLATSYAWGAGAKTLTLVIRSGVKWSDGKTFSAADVAFTFNYIRAHSAVDNSGIWADGLASVKATGPNTVLFSFARPNTAALPFIVGQLIVPQHIWSSVADPATYANLKPVGTGPFLLKSYSPLVVTYKKNPNYWMAGRPYLSGIVMTAVKVPALAAEALATNHAAVTYGLIADPERTYVALDPVDNHIYWPVVGLNLLYFNTTRAPFNDVHFRRAVAEALDDSVIARRAYYGAIPPGDGPVETAVTNGQDAEWVPSSLSSLEWRYNEPAAAATLAAAGYKNVRGSLVDPQGRALPTFKILVGSGWADYISIAQSVTEELAPLGIHTTLDQQPYGPYVSLRNDSNYDIAISWSNNNNATPYYAFSGLLDGNPQTDWERYSSATDTAALASFATTPSLAVQKADAVAIERDILTKVPAVTLTGRPNFLEYSTINFTGWPSTSDPYTAGEAPDSFNGGAEQVFLNVHLK